MKFKNIKIENFRNFNNISISLDNRNVFFGLNDVGKTNFLYALRFLLDYTIRADGFELTDFHNSDDNIDIKILLEIDISDQDNEDTKKIIAKAGKSLSSTSTSLFIQSKSIKDDDGMYSVDLYWGGNLDKLDRIPQIGNKSELDWLFDINYIGAQIDLDKLFKRAVSTKTVLVRKREDDTILKEKIDELNLAIEGLSTIRDFGALIKTEISKYDSNIELKLSSKDTLLDPYKTLYPFLQKEAGTHYYLSGDGLRKITYYSLHRLIALKNQGKKITIFLVEEPENHFHKTTLLKLCQVLFKESEFPYLFLTTHSSELLAEMDKINLVRITSADKTYSHFYTVPEAYQKVKKMLNSNLARALFYDRVLLVEGASEVMLFDTILTHKCNYKIKGLEILPVNGIDFEKYLDVLIPLNIAVYLKTDNDVTNAGITLGLNRLKKLGKKVAELNHDETKKTQIDSFVIDRAEESKSALYSANITLIELCNSENIYLSKNDLENDLAEALPDTITVRLKDKLKEDKLGAAVEYLQDSKLYHMIELVLKLENDDIAAILRNGNFAVLERFTHGIF